jgi:RimJ/RimL family protein N-acetyltransferase
VRLETERLVIRPWRLDEAPRLFEILSDPEMVRWFGTREVLTDLSQAVERIEGYLRLDAPGGVWVVAHAETDLMLGGVMLIDDPVQIGWYLHPDSSGHGYAAEAARAVLDHGLASGFTEIRAVTDIDNHASIAVARRIGMRHVGRVDEDSDRPSEMFVVP